MPCAQSCSDQIRNFFKKSWLGHIAALHSLPFHRPVYLGHGLRVEQRVGVWSVGRKMVSGLTNSLHTPNFTTPPQLRACIESLGLQFIWIASAEAEWSVVGPWLGWGGVKCEARSAECPPTPPHRWPRVRVCVLEQRWEKWNATKPAGTKNVWFCFCLCKCVIL